MKMLNVLTVSSVKSVALTKLCWGLNVYCVHGVRNLLLDLDLMVEKVYMPIKLSKETHFAERIYYMAIDSAQYH